MNNHLYFYSLPDLKVLGGAELGGMGAGWVTLTPDGKTAYVANPVTNDVSVVDVKTMKETARIPVGLCQSAIRQQYSSSRSNCSREAAMRRMTRGVSCSLVVACAGLACACSRPAEAPEPSGVTVFEGARLITGDGSAAIENSAFIVENARFTQVGRRGEVTLPAGAVRTDLTGKTVMPAMVDLHGHLGFQNVAEGTMSKETFTARISSTTSSGSPITGWAAWSASATW